MLKTTLKRYMKPLCIAAISLVVFQSCQKSEIEEQSEEIEPLRNYLAITTGHKLNQINYISATKTFIIDKDVLMSLEDAKDRYEKEGTKELTLSANGTSQRVYTYTVNPTVATDIKVYADATVNANWVSILDQAIAHWNAVGSKLRFTRVTGVTTTAATSVSTSFSAVMGTSSNGKGRKDKTPTTDPTAPTSPTSPTTEPTTPTTSSTYHILVTTNYENSSTLATAYYPWNGNPGHTITINTYYNGISDSYKLFGMIHEIGHTVGFTHTDGTFGTLVPGTPTVDQNSVMNSFVLSWSSFTNYDLLAIRTIYPR